MKAYNIAWDIDPEDNIEELGLPSEVEIPEEISKDPEYSDPEMYEQMAEHISDWLSDTYQFCHSGFLLDSVPIRTFDIVLIEKPNCDGLTKSDVTSLYDTLNGYEAYPIEIGDKNGNSTAMGFISINAAEQLEYDYDQNSALASYISLILDDTDQESENGIYEFEGLSIRLSR